jgi:hypothetical protein
MRTVKLTEYGTMSASWFYEIELENDDGPSDPAELVEWVKERIKEGDFVPYDSEAGDAIDGGEFSEATVINKTAESSTVVP